MPELHPSPMLTTSPATSGSTESARTAARLGEELPVFCETCGYSLHGLPQRRCGDCQILQFKCPECGHHQPINTLRPAFQSILGRMRAAVLVGLMLFKIGVFGLLLLGWFAMGAEWSYEHNPKAFEQIPNNTSGGSRQVAAWQVPARHTLERFIAFGVFGTLFGGFTRMLLLRWRRGYLVGLVLAALVTAAVLGGAWVQWYDSTDNEFTYTLPWTRPFAFVVIYGAAVVLLAASAVWPIWCALVSVFLPRRVGRALLDWQRAMSAPLTQDSIAPAAQLARE